MRWWFVVVQASLNLLLLWLVASLLGGSLADSLTDPFLLLFLFFSVLVSAWCASRLRKEWVREISGEFRAFAATAFEEEGTLDERAFKRADELRKTLQTTADKQADCVVQ